MKERPILMSAPMVRAILDGTKTQTRRVVKGDPFRYNPPRSPYGMRGDLLWVRETWKYTDWTDDGYPFLKYRADGKILLRDDIPSEQSSRVIDIWANLSEPENYDIDGLAADRRWRSSIHMPRWASRILLEVTSVRVERLQDISIHDAMAEGVVETNKNLRGLGPCLEWCYAYEDLWRSINGPDSWNSNPWVWVIEFRRLKP